ncbi:Na+/H+ antiporter NhaC family protein [Romboutsia weinsteinii]|uniref:Na+/H+ antiporter NhaC family protein n=1 Tax=Romboutsia weinsteinii TaxID=2020949 RepID=A0A371J0C4_9FIRM|nr:Na+/H+ antiporter NhaC family protein [Romboutsia weinsteinii]RDY26251.1 Na+/H+ antiporter NhaC family protein [Romboutsia weinsteinii]
MEGNYGILALVPAIIAIAMCFKTKMVIPSLFAGVFASGLIINKGNIFSATSFSLDTIVNQLCDPGNAKLIMFTMFMGVGISFIWKMGGSRALSIWARKKIKSRRTVGIGAWILGMCISINDCLIAAIDGNVFRDIAKEERISSEKFSYILDSTAAPSASLFISDWIAFQIGMISQGLAAAGIAVSPMKAYISSIPYNMYAIFTLVFVGMIVITGLDYGPMLKAERRAMKTGKFCSDEAQPMLDVSSELGEPKDVKPRLATFIIPFIAMIITTIFGFIYTGRAGVGFMGILENADAVTALLWGSFAMAISGVTLALVYKIMDFKETMDTFMDGLKLMVLTAAILLMAWSLGEVTKQMGLAGFLVGALGDAVPAWILPIVIFLLGMIVSFATGTSWGTMAIITPIAIPLVYQVTGDATFAMAVPGMALSGAIFGDHCSPISDTTVMASIFAGADHIDHVRTQIPYGLTVSSVVFIILLLIGIFRLKPYVFLPLGILMLFVIVYIMNKINSRNLKDDDLVVDKE